MQLSAYVSAGLGDAVQQNATYVVHLGALPSHFDWSEKSDQHSLFARLYDDHLESGRLGQVPFTSGMISTYLPPSTSCTCRLAVLGLTTYTTFAICRICHCHQPTRSIRIVVQGNDHAINLKDMVVASDKNRRSQVRTSRRAICGDMRETTGGQQPKSKERPRTLDSRSSSEAPV